MKIKKLGYVLLASSLAITSSSLVFAKGLNAPVATSTQEASVSDRVVIEGEVGTIVTLGNLVFEIVENTPLETRASQSGYSETSLSGTEMSKSFNLAGNYKYAKVWIENKGSNSIVFTITKGSPTGTIVNGSDVTVAANTKVSVYSTNTWSSDTYYANFTSGKSNMSGKTSCRIASSIPELDL